MVYYDLHIFFRVRTALELVRVFVGCEEEIDDRPEYVEYVVPPVVFVGLRIGDEPENGHDSLPYGLVQRNFLLASIFYR